MQVEVSKTYLTRDSNAVFLCYRVKSKKEASMTLTYQQHIYVGLLIGLNTRSEIAYDNNATYTEEGMFRKVPSCLDLIGEATLEELGKAMQEYINRYKDRAGEVELDLFYKLWKDK